MCEEDDELAAAIALSLKACAMPTNEATMKASSTELKVDPEDDENLTAAVLLSLKLSSASPSDENASLEKKTRAEGCPQESSGSHHKDDTQIRPGKVVKVTGLTKASHLNGLRGIILRRDPNRTEHWEVEVWDANGGTKISVKPGNLIVEEATEAECLPQGSLWFTHAEDESIHPGRVVNIMGLANASSLNERRGYVLGLDPRGTGRWQVEVEDANGEVKIISIKPCNLVIQTNLSEARCTDLSKKRQDLDRHFALGCSHLHFSQYKKAVERFAVMLTISREIGDQQSEGFALGNLAIAYLKLGQCDKGIDHITSKLAISRESGDRKGEGMDLSNLGNAYMELGEYHKALEQYTAALAISREIGDRQGEGYRFSNLGMVYRSLGKYDKAIEYMTAALTNSREIGDRQNEVGNLGNLGSVYVSLGYYNKAIEHCNAGLAISHEIGDREGEGNCLSNLGSAYSSLGQDIKAIEYYTAALAISSETGNRQSVGSDLGNLGIAYSNTKQYHKAIEHMTAALTISREIGDREGEGRYLNSLGHALKNLARNDIAIERFSAALAISREIGHRKIEGSCLFGIGTTYLSLGQYDNAIAHLTPALTNSREIGDRESEGRCLGNLGCLYFLLGHYHNALRFFQDAAAIFDLLWDALSTDEQRVTFMDSELHTVTACRLQELHARLGQPEAALERAERTRSRAFELLLAQQRLGHDGTPTASAELKKSSQQHHAPLDFATMRSFAVRHRTAIVFFSQVRPALLLIWLISSSPAAGLILEQLQLCEKEMSLTELIELTRRTINVEARHMRSAELKHGQKNEQDLPVLVLDEGLLYQHRTTTHDRLLRRCHELLIEPLGDALAGEARHLIVPDQDIFALPFAALRDADGRHLIEKHALQVAPSVGTLIELERRSAVRNAAATGAAPATALVVGDPDFNGYAKQLPGARKEATEVFKQLSGACFRGRVTLLTQKSATKQAVCAAMHDSEIIHLATHGSPDGVFLSASTEASGKLSMAEVQELELPKAKLVVLSECDSFRGELRTDGVIGITRAFAAAGASTLLATLWGVNDAATCLFMGRFYYQLLRSPTGDAAAALQGAMVSMIRDGYEVEKWAPFVIYGIGVIQGTADAAHIAIVPLADELIDLLETLGLINKLQVAFTWCEQHGTESVNGLIEAGLEAAFADALQLKPIKKKLLLNSLARRKETITQKLHHHPGAR